MQSHLWVPVLRVNQLAILLSIIESSSQLVKKSARGVGRWTEERLTGNVINSSIARPIRSIIFDIGSDIRSAKWPQLGQNPCQSDSRPDHLYFGCHFLASCCNSLEASDEVLAMKTTSVLHAACRRFCYERVSADAKCKYCVQQEWTTDVRVSVDSLSVVIRI